MNGRIEYVNNFNGETGYVIIRWYKTSAPLTAASGYVTGTDVTPGFATQVVYSNPHNQRNLLIEQIDPVMFIVRAFRSSDGISLDEEIPIALAVDASNGAVFPIERYDYTVDGGQTYDDPDDDPDEGPIVVDPLNESSSLRDPRLKDRVYWVHERGTGYLFSDEITDRSDDGGGFDFTNPDKKFYTDGRYTVFAINRVDVPNDTGSGGSSSSSFVDVMFIESDTVFDPNTMNGKVLICINGKLTMPLLSTLADCRFKYQTHSLSQFYGTIEFGEGDIIKFFNQSKNKLHFPSGEDIDILIRENAAYVVSYNGNYMNRGNVVIDYNGNRADLIKNLVLADESIGTKNISDFPGIDEFLDSLPIGSVVSLGSGPGQWSEENPVSSGRFPNKSKWGRDSGAGLIRFPHLTDKTPTFDNSAIAGTYEHDQVGPLSLEIRDGAGGSSTGTINNTGFSGQDNPSGWIPNTVSGVDRYIRTTSGITETKVRGFTQKAFIIL